MRSTDGRWRSTFKNFPAEGVREEDLRYLRDEGFVEMTETVAVVTDFGRSVVQIEGAYGNMTVTPAMQGTQGAHPSLQ